MPFTTPEGDKKIAQYHEMINDYFKDGDLTMDELIEKVHSEVGKQIGLLKYLRDLKDLNERVERDQEMYRDLFDRLEQREKRVQKFLKDFFKDFPQFKEVPERKGCHSILMFDEEDLKNYHVFLNNDSNEEITDALNNDLFRVVYLKNTNPRDSKKSTFGHIKHSKPSKNFNR